MSQAFVVVEGRLPSTGVRCLCPGMCVVPTTVPCPEPRVLGARPVMEWEPQIYLLESKCWLKLFFLLCILIQLFQRLLT